MMAGAGLLAMASGVFFGQDAPAPEPTLEELRATIARLSSIIADQERRWRIWKKRP